MWPTTEYKPRPAAHLINILRDTRAHHPNFVLFLGAGASVTSGVPSAGALVNEWRDKFRTCYDKQEIKIEDQPWHKNSEEYSRLFEILYDQQSQRREYIESKVKDAAPSWGYIYLVNLIKNNVFNTVFTTNFDDLLNEACYLFSSDLRPIVCAHDSSIQYVRITSKRPKIVKLHGDFLFDNIKNTMRELETLEENMKNKFRQFASEFGFIFLGYSGRDRSVMDVLGTLTRFDSNFPHGVYWCIRKGEEPSQTVKELTKNPKFTLIEVDGFDEFCAECHESLGLPLQKELQDPYGCLTNRLNSLLDRVRATDGAVKNVVIKADIQKLAHKLSALIEGKTDTTTESKPAQIQQRNVPLILLSQAAEQEGDYKKALDFAMSELHSNPSIKAVELAFRNAAKLNDKAQVFELVKFLDNTSSLFSEQPGLIFNMVVDLLINKQYEGAEKLLEVSYNLFGQPANRNEGYDLAYHWINSAQTKLHQGKILEPDLKVNLERIAKDNSNPYARFGAYIVLREEHKAIQQICQFAKLGNHTLESLIAWPIIDLLSASGKQELLEEVRKIAKR